jgi:dTDP-4-amino-4,6-dideoxygalactose transaminase
LKEFTERRCLNAAFLNARIHNPRVITPQSTCQFQSRYSAKHVWHQYTIRVVDGNRDEAVRKLNAAGVGTGIFYPVPAHQQKHIHDLGYAPQNTLPVAEQMAQEVISLPVHPSLTESDLECIVNAVNAL